MKWLKGTLRLRVGLALGSALLVAGLGFPAQAARADESNTQTVNQTEIEEEGNATSSGGGEAMAGAATTYSVAKVRQHNVQVIAGSDFTEANSTQTARNDATINQMTAAVSGDATGTNGGVANSGPATAGSVAFVHQMNIQVIAGPGDCAIDQTAANQATVNQTTGAMSGDAAAEGTGSQAGTGSASARSMDFVHQRNVQIFICKDGGTGSQNATNTAVRDQIVLASSGEAGAFGASTAGSGAASAESSSSLWQLNHQITFQ